MKKEIKILRDLEIDENLKISDEHTNIHDVKTIVNDTAYQDENNSHVHNFNVPGSSMRHLISSHCYNETNACSYKCIP